MDEVVLVLRDVPDDVIQALDLVIPESDIHSCLDFHSLVLPRAPIAYLVEYGIAMVDLLYPRRAE